MRTYNKGPAHERVLANSVRTEKGCLEFQGAKFYKGYGNVSVRRPGGTWGNKGAHIVTWEAVHGPVPPGYKVCHQCDNPPCVDVDHLFLGTQKDNLDDMTRKGRRRTVSVAERDPQTGRYRRRSS